MLSSFASLRSSHRGPHCSAENAENGPLSLSPLIVMRKIIWKRFTDGLFSHESTFTTPLFDLSPRFFFLAPWYLTFPVAVGVFLFLFVAK